ncbi:MAG: hypothetical protein M3Z85_12995 [Acidobacteriota bacterium]|nr:hypothetical protein [Acidobacteriota bacterium]
MAGTISLPTRLPARTRAAEIPWYIWLSALAVTSAMVGVHWDISWHRSIGRDTFFTPAHVAIYLCGVLAGITCGYLILSTTFGNSPLKEASVNIWGFRGPLGAFISAWGGFVMLASAPFDDWWHSAYGLDVKILSPPHIVLAVGMIAVEIGALILIQSYRNRAWAVARSRLEDLFLYVAAMIMVALLVISLELTSKVSMHRGGFYRVVCMLVPVVLAAASKASGRRWAATITATIYTLFLLGFLWILPLFPAQPKLGPVYHQVKFFIPAGFPLLIVFPSLALDLLWARTSKWNAWLVSLVSGFVFLAMLFAVQWPFADFLMSPAARNAIFGSAYLDYYSGPNSYQARYAFLPSMNFWPEMALALLAAILTTRFGFAWGNWMRDVRR